MLGAFWLDSSFVAVRYIFNDSEMAVEGLFYSKRYPCTWNEKNDSASLEIDLNNI